MRRRQNCHDPMLINAVAAFSTLVLGYALNTSTRFARNLVENSTSTDDRETIDPLIVVHGVNDIVVGICMIYVTSFTLRSVLGWTLISAGGLAFLGSIVLSLGTLRTRQDTAK
ncbi:uncharacterized protein BJX67DRAFT_342742 [Aspergillus lucknowensis]|uniref:Uncharacterized protein n=1 Tax=Aspergillus lucknowensis TaxID=176173 RepID=A0ABR4M4V1_9EURO